MPGLPKESPWSGQATPDLLGKASSVLVREASRIGAILPGILPQDASGVTPAAPAVGADIRGSAARTCPVTGAVIPLEAPNQDRLRQQAHELLADLFAPFQRTSGEGAVPIPAQGGSEVSRIFPTGGPDLQSLAGHTCPATGAQVPLGGLAFDKDRLRRQAHEFIESLLVTFGQATGEKPAPYEDQVPLIRCVAAVQAGGEASASMRVSNDEGTPCEVTLYCTNFVADSGYEIASLRVTVSPRRVTIPAKGDAAFEIKIAVSQQTPAGIYSGLIQAMGSKYVKAVLSVDVL